MSERASACAVQLLVSGKTNAFREREEISPHPTCPIKVVVVVVIVVVVAVVDVVEQPQSAGQVMCIIVPIVVS